MCIEFIEWYVYDKKCIYLYNLQIKQILHAPKVHVYDNVFLFVDYKNINSTGPDGRAVEVIPSFVKSIVGQNVFLFCKPTGFLSYTPAKWYKDGKPLILAEHDNMEVIQTLQLNIARFMEADAGFYTCVIHDLILDEMFGQTVQVIAGGENS